ncbi:MAG: cell division protein WhiA [Kosmotogales bacterium]|nr:cell division protein WhiA [Kosmotogales bacterium]
MSFAEKIKEELCSLEITDKYEAISELMGFIKSKGTLRIRDNGVYLVIYLSSISALKRLYKVTKYLNLKIFETQVIEIIKLNRNKGGEIIFDYAKIENFFIKHDFLIRNDNLPDFLKHDPVYFGDFLRGLFISGGSLVDPKKEYHLEITLDTDHEFIEDLLYSLSETFNIEAKLIRLGKKYKVYIKSSSDIKEFLSIIGSMKHFMALSQTIEMKKIRGNVTRTLNFLSANANKSAQAIVKQVQAINYIKKNGGFDLLSDDLKQLVELRLNNEEMSLKELGELYDPPISKSSIYNKFRKIFKIAEELGG